MKILENVSAIDRIKQEFVDSLIINADVLIGTALATQLLGFSVAMISPQDLPEAVNN